MLADKHSPVPAKSEEEKNCITTKKKSMKIESTEAEEREEREEVEFENIE